MDHDISNREVIDELESWRFRHWFTPQNVVSIGAFVIIGTVGYVNLDRDVAAAQQTSETAVEMIASEKARRIEQVKTTEDRINRQLEKLESSINSRFSEQNNKLENIQNLMIQMLQGQRDNDLR